MAQINYRANLRDSDFPLVSQFQGRSVIQPSLDNFYVGESATSTTVNDRDKGVPEVYYMHNVIPVIGGYKSVQYKAVVAAVIPSIALPVTIRQVFQVKDFSGNKGLIVTTEEGETYIVSGSNKTWTNITPPGQLSGATASVANVTGSSFICYANFGIFQVNLTSNTLSSAALIWTGTSPLVTNASILGISASNNYLLAYTSDTLYWSSSLNVLDMSPSQITGAGSGTPAGASGNIITVSPVGIGFAVYCQGNIIVASYSGNTQYPWLFKEAPNGSGIASALSVASSGEDNSNYAWTSAGIMKVTLGGCAPVYPEVSDFLAGKIFEDYNSTTDTIDFTYLVTPLKVRLAFCASRYLVISYGVNSYTHALIYDISMKRMGKLKLSHAQVIDIDFDADSSNFGSYYDMGTASYESYGEVTYNTIVGNPNVAPAAKHSIVLVQLDGTIQLMQGDYGLFASDAVLLLGKYQLSRANLTTMQGLAVDMIDATNTNFSLELLTSYDGKTYGSKITPYVTVYPEFRSYQCVATGVNHSILIKGSFHITSLVLTFTVNGNR